MSNNKGSLYLKLTTVICLLCLQVACVSRGILSEVEKPPAGNKDITKLVEYGRELIRVAMDKGRIEGMSIALVDKNGVLWSEGFGWASKQNNQLLTADTAIQIGSVTKLFTAIAIMQLVEQGKINLDSPITTYIPEFHIQSRFADNNITVRHLLTHHSGLPSDLLADFASYQLDNLGDVDLVSQFRHLPTKIHTLHAVSPPGYAHSYSNLAYSLLGLVVERVSGNAYETYVAKNLLAPLQMSNAAIVLPHTINNLNLAHGFRGKKEVAGALIRDYPAGGMAASANDMAKLLSAFIANGKGILAEKTFQQMISRQNQQVALDGDFRMGLGFHLSSIAQTEPTAVHGGYVPPYSASLRFFPQAGLGIALISNCDQGSRAIGRIASLILEAAHEVNAPLKSNTVKPADIAVPVTVPLTETVAKDYSGYYASRAGLLRIQQKSERLALKFRHIGIGSLPINYVGKNSFVGPSKSFPFIPIPDSLNNPAQDDFELQFEEIDGQQIIFLLRDGIKAFFAIQLEIKPIPQSWMDSIGNYKSVDNKPGAINIAEIYEDKPTGFLFVVFKNREGQRMGASVPIEMYSNQLANTIGVGRSSGEVIEKLPNGNLLFNGLEFKKTGRSLRILPTFWL